MNRRYSLKKGCEIEALVKGGRTVGDRYYTIYYVFCNDITPQIAVSVSKKIRTVVTKNHEKRVIKEIIRANIELLSGTKALVIAKAVIGEIGFNEKQSRLLRLLKRLNKEKK